MHTDGSTIPALHTFNMTKILCIFDYGHCACKATHPSGVISRYWLGKISIRTRKIQDIWVSLCSKYSLSICPICYIDSASSIRIAWSRKFVTGLACIGPCRTGNTRRRGNRPCVVDEGKPNFMFDTRPTAASQQKKQKQSELDYNKSRDRMTMFIIMYQLSVTNNSYFTANMRYFLY